VNKNLSQINADVNRKSAAISEKQNQRETKQINADVNRKSAKISEKQNQRESARNQPAKISEKKNTLQLRAKHCETL